MSASEHGSIVLWDARDHVDVDQLQTAVQKAATSGAETVVVDVETGDDSYAIYVGPPATAEEIDRLLNYDEYD